MIRSLGNACAAGAAPFRQGRFFMLATPCL